MNYVSEKEFRNQSEKVRKVLLDWWRPQIGDLIHVRTWYDIKKAVIIKNNKDTFTICYIDSIMTTHETYKKDKFMPLFQMHQLIKFIEDKTCCKMQIEYNGDFGYAINVDYSDSYGEYFWDYYENLGHDLLQALWKVVCKIGEDN